MELIQLVYKMDDPGYKTTNKIAELPFVHSVDDKTIDGQLIITVNMHLMHHELMQAIKQ